MRKWQQTQKVCPALGMGGRQLSSCRKNALEQKTGICWLSLEDVNATGSQVCVAKLPSEREKRTEGLLYEMIDAAVPIALMVNLCRWRRQILAEPQNGI